MGYPSEITLENKVYSHTGNGIFEYDDEGIYKCITYELLTDRVGFISKSEVSLKIGDDVVATHPNNVLKGKLLALTKQYAIISQGEEEQHLQLVNWKLTKAKTPEEELRDELMEMATTAMSDDSYDLDHNCYYLISGLMKKYKIEPRE